MNIYLSDPVAFISTDYIELHRSLYLKIHLNANTVNLKTVYHISSDL